MTADFIQKTEANFSKLTKGLKVVADALLSDPMIFAIHPAKKVGDILGVSETMVIRFCHSIEYNGYTSLQKEVRQHLLELSQTSNHDMKIEANYFAESVQKDIKMIENNLEKLSIHDMEKIVETIIDCEKIVVAGYHHSFTFAHWLYFNLNYIVGNADLYRPETDAGLLDLLPNKACIIVFSFYRYAIDTIRLAEEAKAKGITVITITDSRVSPVVEFADICISLSINQHTLFSKGPVTLAVINAILFELVERVENRGKIQSTYKYFIKDGE
ncbi:MurR/RpiR family transcriptional regulator [Virgibacillus salexigens]|uniref:MurR/RpiR family transcriptional regulator n=1 Tax=Virgibacillus TaxID=84406 RepID=UPI00136F7E98|nr:MULTISPECIES: MurR/RpiR family transcriptional regulator [Virgibacillus]MYL40415.1 SIS domain-containing protein [Virgibacillus massiliensis]